MQPVQQGKGYKKQQDFQLNAFSLVHLAGDQQIGAKVATNDMDLLIFFRDPLTAQPHEPDISALMRLCDVYQIPLVTNLGGAEVMVRALDAGFFDWRNLQ